MKVLFIAFPCTYVVIVWSLVYGVIYCMESDVLFRKSSWQHNENVWQHVEIIHMLRVLYWDYKKFCNKYLIFGLCFFVLLHWKSFWIRGCFIFCQMMNFPAFNLVQWLLSKLSKSRNTCIFWNSCTTKVSTNFKFPRNAFTIILLTTCRFIILAKVKWEP